MIAPSVPLANLLLDWYDRHARQLPWRLAPSGGPRAAGLAGEYASRGEVCDPYRVWLSEIMLQQTRVATVVAHFQNFLRRWPTVVDLAAARQSEVLSAWAGLGYYARARNLHRCAQIVASDLGGRFPDTAKGLADLPGIGSYTAGAIAAIAFDRPVAAVDGNVERVMARLYGVTEPLPAAKRQLRELAARLVPNARPGDYAQAVMDLGATVCTPAKPACGLCPWNTVCVARHAGTASALPKRAASMALPTRYGVAFWIERAGDGAVMLRRRPQTGLLGGMMEVPGTPWRSEAWILGEALKHAPVEAEWHSAGGEVHHTFTHFRLKVSILATKTQRDDVVGEWCDHPDLDRAGLPAVMRKIAKMASGARKVPSSDGCGPPKA